jgi:hypothetical protein
MTATRGTRERSSRWPWRTTMTSRWPMDVPGTRTHFTGAPDSGMSTINKAPQDGADAPGGAIGGKMSPKEIR